MAHGDGDSNAKERDAYTNALPTLSDEDERQSFGARASATQVARSAELKLAPAWRRWGIIALTVVALLAVVGVVIARLQPAPKSSQPQTFAIDPATLGIGCTLAEAWSPDSAQVALVGTQDGCNASQVADGATTVLPNAVVFISATTGKRLGEIQPDANVQLALKAAGFSTPQVIIYQGAIWSRDGKRLALPFTVEYQTAAGDGTEGDPGTFGILAGLSVVTVNGPALSVTYLTPENEINRFSGVWDLKTSKPVLLSAAPANGVTVAGEGNLRPAALRYSWQADGTLATSNALNATSAPHAEPGPIGNPDGDASFTIWQPMTVAPDTGDPAHPVSPAPLTLTTTLLAWSPDGNYLLTDSLGPWRVQPNGRPAPGPDQLKATFTQNMPLAPVRDAAFNFLLDKISASAGFAWSPDGRMLSALKLANGSASLLVLDCASGKTLATIPLPTTSMTSALTPTGGLAWSPDGKRMTVVSNSELYIVGPDKLPQE